MPTGPSPAVLRDLLERVRAAKGPDWRLDEEILSVLGWNVRRVTGLGLNGRTPGSVRAWPPGSASRLGYAPLKPTAMLIDAIKLTKRHVPGAAVKGTALEQCATLLVALLTQDASDAEHV